MPIGRTFSDYIGTQRSPDSRAITFKRCPDELVARGATNRTDFHDLCKHGPIIFVIVLTPVNQLIAYCVQHQHRVLAFAQFALIVVLKIAHSGL